jgi:predicted MPP superfamily phosphohydrolase
MPPVGPPPGSDFIFPTARCDGSSRAVCKTLVIGPSISRRRLLKGAAAAAAAAVAVDASALEPNHPRLVRVEIPLRRLPLAFDGFTIVLLSDFHYDPYFSVRPIGAAVRLTNALEPDLVALTGDFVTTPVFGRSIADKRAALASEPCARLLGTIRARSGVWASLGNHDAYSDPATIERALRRSGIEVLRNRAVPIERDNARFWLAGVDDVMARGANLDAALHGVPPTHPVILLVHEPDFADSVVRYPVDLQLSGHSHGGQVRFPLMGAVYLPELARKYPLGLYRFGGLTLYTNAGLGTLRIPVRWNCPPEVTHITLRAPGPF